MYEKLYDYFQHGHDDDPINVLGIGECLWDDDFSFSREKCELTAIEFVLGGEGVLENNGETYNLRKNDVFVLRKGSRHAYYPKHGSEWRKMYVMFTGDLAEILLDAYLPNGQCAFPNCAAEPLFRELHTLAERYKGDYRALNEAVTVQFIRILNFIRDSGEKSIEAQMRDYLENSIDKPFSLKELCETFSYSKNHVINRFEEKYGITPYRYYMEKKLEAAKRMLEDTGFPLSDIAERLAFSDQQYFSAWFKSMCGVPPSAYKKAMKEKNAASQNKRRRNSGSVAEKS